MERLPDNGPKKQPLWQRMYSDPAVTEFVRFIGYNGRTIEEGKSFVLDMEKKYGRQKVIDASEAVTVAEGKAENIRVRLSAEARRLAHGLLGRPPEAPPLMSLQEMVGPDPAKEKPVEPKEKPKRTRKKAVKKEVDPPGSLANSPLMQQWRQTKEQNPGMLLLFRIGDFYELFHEDAETAAKTLGLTLTTRDRATPMAGFPHHALEAHLHKLLRSGHRVAVCEQVDASDGKTVKREVTRAVTPGSMVGGAGGAP